VIEKFSLTSHPCDNLVSPARPIVERGGAHNEFYVTPVSLYRRPVWFLVEVESDSSFFEPAVAGLWMKTRKYFSNPFLWEEI